MAIKQIDLRLGPPEQRAKLTQRLQREVCILSNISHENVLCFYGLSFSELPFQIVTEFCEGETVFDLYHDAADGVTELSWLQRHKVICDVAHAMRYLHSQRPPVIHRDLKSLNLLLAKPVTGPWDVPLVKVADFGLSRLNDAAAYTCNMGTSHWMAPEVLAGTAYDEKVDVFSFAVVVYELLCLAVPFSDLRPEEVLRLTLAGKRASVEDVPPECPAELAGPLTVLMEACWQQSPRARPSFERVLVVLEGPLARALDAPSRSVSL